MRIVTRSPRGAPNNESTAHHTDSHRPRDITCRFAGPTKSASRAISDRSCRAGVSNVTDLTRTRGRLTFDWISVRKRLTSKRSFQGSPNESSLLGRITSDDPDLRMPPSGDPLSAKQIEALRSWIKDGAKYERHWAYTKPKAVAPPQVNHDWPRTNPIDNFVQARLSEKGMQPSPPAKPAVLLRRLSLDLVGLPPTVEQVIAFEQDPTDKNYEAAVDRLLQSKHFGEKWALHWLDLARYADSNGYQHDDLRTMWPYRDWVINASEPGSSVRPVHHRTAGW